MSFSALPSELLLKVFSHVTSSSDSTVSSTPPSASSELITPSLHRFDYHYPDLCSFSLVSKIWYDCASEVLWRRIVIRSETKAEAFLDGWGERERRLRGSGVTDDKVPEAEGWRVDGLRLSSHASHDPISRGNVRRVLEVVQGVKLLELVGLIHSIDTDIASLSSLSGGYFGWSREPAHISQNPTLSTDLKTLHFEGVAQTSAGADEPDPTSLQPASFSLATLTCHRSRYMPYFLPSILSSSSASLKTATLESFTAVSCLSTESIFSMSPSATQSITRLMIDTTFPLFGMALHDFPSLQHLIFVASSKSNDLSRLASIIGRDVPENLCYLDSFVPKDGGKGSIKKISLDDHVRGRSNEINLRMLDNVLRAVELPVLDKLEVIEVVRIPSPGFVMESGLDLLRQKKIELRVVPRDVMRDMSRP